MDFKSDRRASKRERAWLNLAMKVADASECTMKHGAVLVKGGRVLAVGMNKPRNHNNVVDPSENAYTTHAEMDACSRAAMHLGAIMYVARVNNDGKPMLSIPCNACLQALARMGVKRVVYTTGEAGL